MFKTKRKRAVVLALIAFFCTAAVTYVAVDWKRFGGGFLAFFKGGKGDPVLASTGGTPGSKAGQIAAGGNTHSNAPALPRLVAVASRRHTSGVAGANGHKPDDDLFKYGDPAAGGIPPGNFLVAQNDTPGGGNLGDGFAPAAGTPAAPEAGSPAPAGGEGGGAGVSSPAPAPAGTGSGDGGLPGGGAGTTPAPPAATPPAATPPAGSPPAASPPAATPPAPAPTQSGTTDDPPVPPPSTSLPPVSSVPEASSLAMMSLGALFLAVAASRKRKQA